MNQRFNQIFLAQHFLIAGSCLRLWAGRGFRKMVVKCELARGIAFLNAGNATDAVGRFEAALDMDSGFAPAQYWLGVGLIELGRTEQASLELEHYLQLEPTGEFAAEARTHLSHLR